MFQSLQGNIIWERQKKEREREKTMKGINDFAELNISDGMVWASRV